MHVAPTSITSPRRARRSRPALPWLLVAALIAVVLYLVADLGFSGSRHTIVGSGIPATQTRTVAPFSAVTMTGTADLAVRTGVPQAVVITADNNIIDRVTTRVQAGSLIVGTKSGSYSTRTPITAQVTVPSVGSLILAGEGTITATRLRAPELSLALAGMGSIHARGTTGRLTITIAGSGDADLSGLRATNATAVVSGNGSIVLTATGSLDATVTGNGEIRYLGNPHVTTHVAGNGEVVHG